MVQRPVVGILILTAILAFVPVSAIAQLRAQLIASGLARPLAVIPDPRPEAAPNTFILLQRNGLALALVDGVVQPTPFLDLRTVVTDHDEQGLLGLAIAPHDPNQVFVLFTNKRDPSLPFPELTHGDTVVARFLRSSDPLVLDPTTRFDFIWPPPLAGFGEFRFIYQPTFIHKGGNMIFGPDGYLYIGLGDGGLSDCCIERYSAQHPQSVLGKFLRLDVNVPLTHPRGYVVPLDNPFVDQQPIAALPEIWSLGYRNPWRWSFDDFGQGATNAMIVGDVGLETREEIDYEPAGRGGRNYGWYMREGLIATPGHSQTGAPIPLTNPIADYDNPIDGSSSVTGGYVYRGSALPSVYRGRYFFADFFGGVYSLGLTLDAAGEARIADVLDHSAELGNLRLIPTFGRGLDGELYLTSFVGGSVYKIVADTTVAPPAAPAPFTVQLTESTLSLAWQPSATGGPTVSYRLEAGSQPGTSDLATLEMLKPSLVVPGVPNGLYYLRVRAINSSGVSEPSQEVSVRVGCGGAMPAPSGLTAQIGAGGVVMLTWTPTAEATSYLLEAGTSAGGTQLGALPVTGAAVSGAVMPGTYFARVRAVTPCGTSGASNEVMIQVP